MSEASQSGPDSRASVRSAAPVDADALAAIYDPYVRRTVVTFEEEPVPAAAMAKRIGRVLETHPWLVLEEGGEVVGYAYAAAWRPRSAYRRSVETTIYLAPDRGGLGLGTRLYGALLDACRARGFHCALGGIALPNPASVALHEKLGFVKVAELRQVGFKLGRWVDVGYWQRML